MIDLQISTLTLTSTSVPVQLLAADQARKQFNLNYTGAYPFYYGESSAMTGVYADSVEASSGLYLTGLAAQAAIWGLAFNSGGVTIQVVVFSET